MCGIAGYIGHTPPDDTAINNALATMVRRGPDHQGTKYIPLPDGKTAVLLSSRLAIVDLDPRSNMPFQKGDWTISFNGEIYNHELLRSQLVTRGAQFTTTSDTEVLLTGLSCDGLNFLDLTEGMWAFAAVNRSTGEFLMSRDRFGEKPLFIHKCSHGIFFGSEIKVIRALAQRTFDVNTDHLLNYLLNGYRSLYKGLSTWFNEVEFFPAASALKIDRAGQLPIKRYWNPRYETLQISEDEAVDQLKILLPRAVELRLRSDVPIACCLSGGIDSSSIASLAVKELGATLHTFSIIDTNPDYDERKNIELIQRDLGCPSHLIQVPKSSFLERLSDLIDYHDAPLATSSYYIHSFLSEAISQSGFRVALSGTGSDEIFTGYYDHYLLHLATLNNPSERDAARLDWSNLIAPHVRNPHFQQWDKFIKEPNFRNHLYIRNLRLISALKVPFDHPFYEVDFGQDLLRNRMLNEIFHEVVPPILYEDDMNSMRWSVENRSPFLDRGLFEFCFSLPSAYLIKNAFQKNLLRKAMEGILIDDIRLNRKKMGFNASMTSILDRSSKEVRAELLQNNPLEEYLDINIILELLDQDSLSNQESQLLFSLVNASLFLKRWS